MSCNPVKRLCKRLIISQAVTFIDNTLVINIPSGSYANNEKYCFVVAQSLPDTTTITAPVVITIGDDSTTTYPLLGCDCTAVTACAINTRTRYSVVVKTGVADGVFSLIGKLPCNKCVGAAEALPVATTTVGG